MKKANDANARISNVSVRLRVESVKMPSSGAIFDKANLLLFFPVFNQTYANLIDPIQRWARVDLTQS